MDESASITIPSDLDAPEAEPVRRRRGRNLERADSGRRRRKVLRTFYFSMASFWGFLVGTAALLVGLSFHDSPVRFSSGIGLFLSIAAVVAVIGGAVASKAYRQAASRGA